MTTGAPARTPAVATSVPLGSTSFVTGEPSRNSARKSSGAGERTVAMVRITRARRTASAVASAAPAASASTSSTATGSSPIRLTTWIANSAPSRATRTACTMSRARPATASTAVSTSTGSTVSATAKSTMSPPGEPRTAKNSG